MVSWRRVAGVGAGEEVDGSGGGVASEEEGGRGEWRREGRGRGSRSIESERVPNRCAWEGGM